MALPEQIRKQTAAVQELYKQLNGENSGETADASPAPEVAASTSSPADTPSVSDEAAPSPAVEQRVGDDKVPEETVLQKYKTLQGMYNAEVPRLHQQNREMQQRIQQMEQLLSSVSSQQPAASSPAKPVEKLVSDKDVEEYGESLDVMRRVSREELNPLFSRLAQMEDVLKQMHASVVPQVQAVAKHQQQSVEQRFWSDLSEAVSNWREINDDQDFQSWLLDVDPLTGITRQTYLGDAQRALDARRVANFFRTWLEKSGQASVAQPVERAPPPASSELEKQVSPGRSRSAGTAQSNKGRMYTPADIEKFFNDVRAGKYKGREQDRSRTERDIFAAQRENRIQFNA